MYASFIVTELKQSIWENMQRIEWVNILVLTLTAAVLLALLHRVILKPLGLVQRSIRHYQVGGDFYDFFLIDNDHLALVMADVSGKGVPATRCSSTPTA